MYVAMLCGVILVLDAVSIYSCFRDLSTSDRRYFWSILIVGLPIAGAALYFLLGRVSPPTHPKEARPSLW